MYVAKIELKGNWDPQYFSISIQYQQVSAQMPSRHTIIKAANVLENRIKGLLITWKIKDNFINGID